MVVVPLFRRTCLETNCRILGAAIFLCLLREHVIIVLGVGADFIGKTNANRLEAFIFDRFSFGPEIMLVVLVLLFDWLFIQ